MKKSIYLFLTIIVSTVTIAQTQSIVDLKDYDPLLGNNIYYQDLSARLDKYQGEWQYSDSNITIKLKLTKRTNHFGELYGERRNISSDDLIMRLIITENGIEKVNTYSTVTSDILILCGIPYEENTINFTYSEPSDIATCQNCGKGFSGDMSVAYSSGSPDTIVVELKDLVRQDYSSTYKDGTPVDYSMLVLPRQPLLFTKI